MIPFWTAVTDLLANKTIRNAESKIGSLGEVAFEVSGPDKIFTVSNLSRNISAKYAEHEVIGTKPLLELTGAALQTISFDIQISSDWGHNPADEIDKLIKYCESGAVLTFILGNGPIGENKWVIESISENAEWFDGVGNITYAKASISLNEYIEKEIDIDENS